MNIEKIKGMITNTGSETMNLSENILPTEQLAGKRINSTRRAIEEDGCIILPSEHFQRIFGNLETIWPSFSEAWNNLKTDEYVCDNLGHRLRRFGRFYFDPKSEKLTPILAGTFYQATELNRLNGGIHRKFASLESGFANHPLLSWLIRETWSYLPERNVVPIWMINVHQIRIFAKSGEAGYPTPEGIHQDGHRYVGQFLIRRDGISGGQSLIYDEHHKLQIQLKLQIPLDSIIVDDKRVFHGVTPVVCKGTSSVGIRDMLLLDFNPFDEKVKLDS